MPPTRRNSFRLLVLTLAVGLIALALVALACAPSSPGEQQGTPEPTSAADPTHTPTPTWQAELSTVAHAVIVKQATIAAESSGATGQSASERPATIRVNIYTADIETRSRIEQFLASNSGTVLHSIPTNPGGLTDFEAVVPVSLLDSLSKQTGVLLIDTIEKYYEKLDKELNSIVSQYDAGLITEQEAVTLSNLPYWESKVLIVADFDTSANAHSALRYLKSNDVYMMSHPAETMVIAGFVPGVAIAPAVSTTWCHHCKRIRVRRGFVRPWGAGRAGYLQTAGGSAYRRGHWTARRDKYGHSNSPTHGSQRGHSPAWCQ